MFSLQRDPQLYYAHSELQITDILKMFELFISTVIHLYVYATHITWKYVGFCHKDQTSLSKIQKCTLRFKISPAVSSKRQQKPLLSWEQITKKTM